MAPPGPHPKTPATPTAPEIRSVRDVYDAHADQVARWVARLWGPGAELEDLVQEVFLVVARQLEGFRGDSKVSTWLYGITANVVRRHRRRERLRQLIFAPLGQRVHESPSAYPTPVESLERRRKERRLYRVLDRLSDRDRDLLILFELEDLTGKEIAELLGITENAVFIRLHRARQRFLQQLRREENKEKRRHDR